MVTLPTALPSANPHGPVDNAAIMDDTSPNPSGAEVESAAPPAPLSIPDLIREHGWDIYHTARFVQGSPGPSNGCCGRAAQTVVTLLCMHGHTPLLRGPHKMSVSNAAMKRALEELGDHEEEDDAELALRFRSLQEKHGGYQIDVANHYWVESDGYIIDCSLPDCTRPHHDIILAPSAGLVNPRQVYIVGGCRIAYGL